MVTLLTLDLKEKGEKKKVGKLFIKQCMVFNEAFPTVKDIATWVNYKTNIKYELLSEV